MMPLTMVKTGEENTIKKLAEKKKQENSLRILDL